MANNILIKEGCSGVLEITLRNGKKTVYEPNCNLDDAQKLLYRFYELETSSGMIVKESFILNNIDWFPTVVSGLYWNYFYQYVKYKKVLNDFDDIQLSNAKCNYGNFFKLITQLFPKQICYKKFNNLMRFIVYKIINFRNRIIVDKNGKLIFFRYGEEDFRTKDIYNKFKLDVVQLTKINKKKILKYIFDKSTYIIYDPPSVTNLTIELYNNTDKIFQTAMELTKILVSRNISNYYANKYIFNKMNFNLLVGIDDANYIYPYLYAAQDLGHKTLGLQHGVYASRHEAYIMKNINNYRWFDNVIVWGEYWKDIVLRKSNLYNDEFHIIGANKHEYNYEYEMAKNNTKSILIPFEFLANTIKIGKYIKQFLCNKFNVYIKVRPDDSVSEQVRSYYLGQDESKIHIITKIESDLMNKIDIIAGTQTTLLFDLLPYNKPTWILQTEFRLLNDMVEDGYAKLIKMEDMPNIVSIYEQEMERKINIDRKHFSGEHKMLDHINKYYKDNCASI